MFEKMRRYRITGLLLVLALLLCLGCTPAVQPPGSGESEKTVQPIEMTDNPMAEGAFVSSVAPYDDTHLEDYDVYELHLTAHDRFYIEDGKLCVSVNHSQGAILLSYNADGTVAEKRHAPNTVTPVIQNVRELSDGTFFYLHTQQQPPTSDDHVDHLVLVSVFDADGQQLYQTELGLTETYLYHTMEGAAGMERGFSPRLHINERADGTRRMLVSTGQTLYYLDECLNILNKVEVPEIYDCPIYMQSDGVYLLGDSLPQMCTVDMNTGEITRVETLPVPKEILYDCTQFRYGADGKLYFRYHDSLYQSDGNGNIKEILRWSQGLFDGDGSFWVLDESTVFFAHRETVYLNAPIASQIPSVLHTVNLDALIDRRIVELVFLEDSVPNHNTWLQELITAFNAQSTDYYINYTVMKNDTLSNGAGAYDRFRDYLLSVGTPDMVIFPRSWVPEYIDNDLLLDLSDRFDDKMLGCLTDGFTADDGCQYLLPLSFQAKFFVAATAVQSTPISWDDFYAYAAEYDQPSKEGALVTDSSMIYTLFDHALTDFYDTETKQCNLDSEEFRRCVRVLDTDAPYIGKEYGMLTGGDTYTVQGSTLVNAVQNGEVRFLSVPFTTVEAYAVCKRVFGDTPFTLCGLPTKDGSTPGVSVDSSHNLAVFADSDTLGGCKAFITFALSDEIQTSASLTESYLPVSMSAMSQALDAYRYLYYRAESSVGEYTNYFTGEIVTYVGISADVHHIERIDSYASSPRFTEYVLSDEEKEIILNFFDTCTSYTTTGLTIQQIVEEELSAYRSGAKTLEEVTRLMQSRVQIYLNE